MKSLMSMAMELQLGLGFGDHLSRVVPSR